MSVLVIVKKYQRYQSCCLSRWFGCVEQRSCSRIKVLKSCFSEMDFDRTKDNDASSDDDNEIQDEVADTLQVQLKFICILLINATGYKTMCGNNFKC